MIEFTLMSYAYDEFSTNNVETMVIFRNSAPFTVYLHNGEAWLAVGHLGPLCTGRLRVCNTQEDSFTLLQATTKGQPLFYFAFILPTFDLECQGSWSVSFIFICYLLFYHSHWHGFPG